MKAEIKTLTEKRLVGLKMDMTLEADKTYDLWHQFMLVYKNPVSPIPKYIGTDLYSIQNYNHELPFEDFNAKTIFEKSAMIEVEDFENIPANFQKMIIPAGFYAVFIHVGLAQNFSNTLNYIFRKWLPNSKFDLDKRPHFEVLGDKYIRNSPLSEEEVWIPIKPKHR